MIPAAVLVAGPILKRLAGPLIVIAALAGLLFLASAVARSIYSSGYAAAEAIGLAKLAQAEADAATKRAEYANKMASLDIVIRDQQAAAHQRLEEAQKRARLAQHRLEEALNANPEFSSAARPPALRGVRDEAFTELERAAARGASLYDSSLPGVPGAGAGGGPDLGRIRTDRPGEPAAVAGVHQPTQ
jgi:hypothetical protein